jgi:hypothetical protein
MTQGSVAERTHECPVFVVATPGILADAGFFAPYASARGTLFEGYVLSILTTMGGARDYTSFEILGALAVRNSG